MSIIKRYSLFVFAVIVQSAGIALVVRSLLGTSPISSLPYVLSLSSPYSLGQTTFAINMLLVLGQVLLLRRDFDRIQLLQVPVTFVFACSIDAFMGLFTVFVSDWYPLQLAALFIGASLVAFGVAVQGIANVLMLPGEGIVYAISRHFQLEFGRVKTANDVCLVLLAACISWQCLGSIEGIREGTLISALITGSIARFFLQHLGTVDAHGQLIWHPHF